MLTAILTVTLVKEKLDSLLMWRTMIVSILLPAEGLIRSYMGVYLGEIPNARSIIATYVQAKVRSVHCGAKWIITAIAP